MPRNISFAKTLKQMAQATKTETRRLRWDFLKAGDELNAVNKTMGLKKGEKPVLIGKIRVVATWRDRLLPFSPLPSPPLGFPELSPDEFVWMFCEMNCCQPNVEIRVIQFERS